ncbi:MAG: ORF6N domain-containing protein [Desulfobacteraceae bacterium]|nr:MAG: ORF6N domain-containing protein [Desulfobacteraceae bacterium]
MEQTNPIEIEGHSIERIDYRGQPVVTFRMVDELHERPEGTAGRAFRYNKDRLIEGEDFFNAPFDEWCKVLPRQISSISKNHAPMIFLTQFGYLLLVKTLTDDLAWKVQRALTNSYFMAGGAGLDGRAVGRAWNRELRLSMEEQRKFIKAVRIEADRIRKGRGSIESLAGMPMIQAAVRDMLENDPKPRFDGPEAGGNAKALINWLDLLVTECLSDTATFNRGYGLRFEPSLNGSGELEAITFLASTRELYAALIRLSRNSEIDFPFKSVRHLGAKQNYPVDVFQAAGWGFKRNLKHIRGIGLHRFAKRISQGVSRELTE